MWKIQLRNETSDFTQVVTSIGENIKYFTISVFDWFNESIQQILMFVGLALGVLVVIVAITYASIKFGCLWCQTCCIKKKKAKETELDIELQDLGAPTCSNTNVKIKKDLYSNTKKHKITKNINKHSFVADFEKRKRTAEKLKKYNKQLETSFVVRQQKTQF